MVNDFNFQVALSVDAKSRSSIALSISLKNNSPQGYYINTDAILLDGITSNKFEISGPSVINTNINNVNYDPTLFFLKSGDFKNNSVVISDSYDFTEAQSGKYQIKFSSAIFPCSDLAQAHCYSASDLVGETEFLLPA